MSETKSAMTGDVCTKRLFTSNFLDFASLCKSSASLRVVGAGFTRNYSLCDGNRFVLVATKKINKYL